ncbi:MAG: SDR family oxidoreductase [Candidatus Bathyarchaeia archaeon]
MDLGLKGKIAIVTGGSKDIGKAVALELSREGATVALCARSKEELEQAEAEIRSATRGEVFSTAADVRKVEDIESFVRAVVDRFGGVNILVNNAGRAKPGSFEQLRDEDWTDDLSVKLFSMIRFSRVVLPYMKSKRWGRIININAIIGRQSMPGFMASVANRGASLAFTKALSDEVAVDNILVNSVNIGFVKTPQWENIWRRKGGEMSFDEFIARMAEQYVPLNRFGEPEEVATLVAFLASEKSSYIAGASVDVGGGLGRYI